MRIQLGLILKFDSRNRCQGIHQSYGLLQKLFMLLIKECLFSCLHSIVYNPSPKNPRRQFALIPISIPDSPRLSQLKVKPKKRRPTKLLTLGRNGQVNQSS